MGFWTRLLGLAVVATNLVGAMCHGYLGEPKARNVVHNSNFCPHCLAAGGPGLTYAGGRTWPQSLHGACGDPHNAPRDHEAGGKFATKKITGTYVPGQTITIRIHISAPHGGRFSFGICPLPDKVTDAQERALATQECFDKNQLINAADGTPYWWFGKKPTGDYSMAFKLPPAIRCKRCVLQWHYESGNSCTIPGTPAEHVMSPNMVACDKTGVMEEFWNCADVRVVGGKPKKDRKGGGASAVPLAVPVAAPVTGPPVATGAVEGYANYGAAAPGGLTVLLAAVAVVIVATTPLAIAVATGTGVLVYLLAQPLLLAPPVPAASHPSQTLASQASHASRRRQRSQNFCLHGK